MAARLRLLAAGMAGARRARLVVLVGVDHDDEALLHHQPLLMSPFQELLPDADARVVVLPPACSAGVGPGAVCRIWSHLAAVAVNDHGCQLAVLLGDDVHVAPRAWPDLVVDSFAADPGLAVLLLQDQADPGFPSFPVLRVDQHLAIFGQLLPDLFINQGGDPYLAALYRSVQGALAEAPGIQVTNLQGGPQLHGRPYAAPRYQRCAPPHAAVLAELRVARWHLLERLPAGSAAWERVTVDVLVPSFRVDASVLRIMEERIMSFDAAEPRADVGLVLVVDSPRLSTAAEDFLTGLQRRMSRRLRLRFNGGNLGASASRNRALAESLADYVVFWDDDIIPSAGCLPAYISSFMGNPEAVAFAGPSYLPKQPSALWPSAVHMSDVSFFWEAPAGWGAKNGLVPWAVTANMAIRNLGGVEFDLRFPKTGGGEDIDFCLRVAGLQRMVAVPKASVTHPWWNGGRRCYQRFYGWACGDGALIDVWRGGLAAAPPRSIGGGAPAGGGVGAPGGAAEGLGKAVPPGLPLAPSAAELLGLLCYLVCLATLAAAAAAAALLLGSAAAFGGAIGGAALAPTALVPGLRLLGATLAVVYSLAGRAAAAVLAAAWALHAGRNLLCGERRAGRPCAWWLRPAAASEAWAISFVSELGRLRGHLGRRGWGLRGWMLVGARFDWFCGMEPGVARAERRREALWFACYTAAAAAALHFAN